MPRTIIFDDKTTKNYPEFRPNITPKQMFQKGSFHDQGGYFRPIVSVPNKTYYENVYKKYTKSGRCLEGVSKDKLVTPPNTKNKKQLNKYNVKAGTSLTYWLQQKWIKPQDPYGWVQWYCEFYDGRRSKDDDRQIKRWIKFAGEDSGRFRKNLMNKIIKAKKSYDDETVAPIIRQSLLQWGYELTERDFEKYKKK